MVLVVLWLTVWPYALAGWTVLACWFSLLVWTYLVEQLSDLRAIGEAGEGFYVAFVVVHRELLVSM